MRRNRPYPPYYSSDLVKSRKQLFAAFDFETANLGGKLLLSSYAYDNGNGFTVDYIVGSPDRILKDTFEVMSEHPKHTWYAHNAQYDWRYMMDYIKRHKLKHEIFMRNKTDIYMLIVYFNDVKIKMQDSLAIWPGTLKTLLEQYAPDLPKLSIDDISHFDPTNPDHVEYAKRDSLGLCVAMSNLNDMIISSYNVSLRPTAASTALAAWEKQLPTRYFINETQEDYIRKAYYGGLVFLRSNKLENNLETYDINSSYPHQMRSYTVPYGNVFQTMNYEPDKYGIYTVTLDTKDCPFPCVPTRSDQGFIMWPLGQFRTTITSIELQFAFDHGYDVLDIHDGIIFEQQVNPFSEFVTNCEKIRNHYKGKPQETLAKLIQNSLYGKFGSKRERSIMFVPETNEDAIGAVPWDEDQYWFIKTERQELRCYPAWAVFITARARLHLLETIFRVGVDNVIYGDTDSLTICAGFSKHIDIGTKYGQWKLEKEWASFRAVAPKVYSGMLRSKLKKTLPGQYYGAAKGLPQSKLNACDWLNLTYGGKVSVVYDSLSSLRVSMKRGMNGSVSARRVVTDIANSKGWVDHGEGVIRPRLLQRG